jgi:putative ABC transport system substrate-binding protein
LERAFLQGLKELGYIEGQNLVIESRYAGGRNDVLPGLAAELVQAKVDVILAGNANALLAAKSTTSTVPLIMTLGADPVSFGVVESLTRPGGNIAGLTEVAPHLTPDRLELLKQIAPGLSRVAILWQPNSLQEATFKKTIADTEARGRLLGVDVQVVEARTLEGFDGAFAAMTAQKADALIVLVSPMFNAERARIIQRAASGRLPAISEWMSFVESGGLVSYGANLPDIYRRAATIADKILKGAKPADLPVEQPAVFDLGINLQTAAALGLQIPAGLRTRANKVIE